MNKTKVIIETRGGVLVAVYSNTPLDYILIDHDLTELGENPVHAPGEPDQVHPVLYELFDSDTPAGLEIREDLKRFHF